MPVSIFKIDTNYAMKPFLSDMMNATSIAFDRAGEMYVSSRNDEAVYKVAPNGTMSTYAEGMGVATGIAFDREENLYVGDRNGTIFKISRDRQIFVFATLEPSVSAYHLAFGPARRPLRHRSQHLELRLRPQGRSARDRLRLLSRPRTSARPRARSSKATSTSLRRWAENAAS